MRRASFIHGIRFRLLVVALALVAVPWLAAASVSAAAKRAMMRRRSSPSRSFSVPLRAKRCGRSDNAAATARAAAAGEGGKPIERRTQ